MLPDPRGGDSGRACRCQCDGGSELYYQGHPRLRPFSDDTRAVPILHDHTQLDTATGRYTLQQYTLHAFQTFPTALQDGRENGFIYIINKMERRKVKKCSLMMGCRQNTCFPAAVFTLISTNVFQLAGVRDHKRANETAIV